MCVRVCRIAYRVFSSSFFRRSAVAAPPFAPTALAFAACWRATTSILCFLLQHDQHTPFVRVSKTHHECIPALFALALKLAGGQSPPSCAFSCSITGTHSDIQDRLSVSVRTICAWLYSLLKGNHPHLVLSPAIQPAHTLPFDMQYTCRVPCRNVRACHGCLLTGNHLHLVLSPATNINAYPLGLKCRSNSSQRTPNTE